MSSGVFISWVKYHGRSEDLSAALGMPALYVTSQRSSLLLRYLSQSRKTWAQLRALRPRVIVVMQPPAVAMVPVLLYASLTRARVVADLHTGAVIGRRWGWSLRPLLLLLRRRHAAVVTNADLARLCRARGVTTFVVDDLPYGPSFDLHASPPPAFQVSSEEYVLVPLSYADDEPLAELMAAARACRDYTFIFTGRAPANLKESAPRNVNFAGYVTNEEYIRLVMGCAAIAALTTRPATMQRAGYEALVAGKPLVTSGHSVLRNYFGDAATYSSIDHSDLDSAFREALSNGSRLRAEMVTLKAVRTTEAQVAVSALDAWLAGCD